LASMSAHLWVWPTARRSEQQWAELASLSEHLWGWPTARLSEQPRADVSGAKSESELDFQLAFLSAH
jgi:hypothetical protein